MESGFVGSRTAFAWSASAHPSWVSSPTNEWMTSLHSSANFLPGWRCRGCRLVLLDYGRPLEQVVDPAPGSHPRRP